jgi:hypothetical protein
MDRYIYCKACNIHIGLAVKVAYEFGNLGCECKWYDSMPDDIKCTRQYLSNDNEVRSCFDDFWDRLMASQHKQTKQRP